MTGRDRFRDQINPLWQAERNVRAARAAIIAEGGDPGPVVQSGDRMWILPRDVEIPAELLEVPGQLQPAPLDPATRECQCSRCRTIAWLVDRTTQRLKREIEASLVVPALLELAGLVMAPRCRCGHPQCCACMERVCFSSPY